MRAVKATPNSHIVIPTSSPLSVETRTLKTGEVPVDILKTSEISIISSKQGDGDDEEPKLPDPQSAAFLAPRDKGDTWTKRTDMPTPRHGLRTNVVEGKIYAVGGRTVNGSLAVPTAEEYDPVKDVWTEKADIPTTRYKLSTSAVNGMIYAIGG